MRRMALPQLSAPEQLSAVMTRIYDKGLTTPSGGNLSLLDDDGGLWVTPSLLDKGRLRPEMMVRIAADGSWSGSIKPTSEWHFHRAVLQARPDSRACAHAHCTSLVAFCLLGTPVPLDLFPDLSRWVNRVEVSPYAHPGSQHLGETLHATFASGCDAALMEKHGAVTCGRDLHQAFCRLDVLERLASIRLAAALLGPPLPVPQARMGEATQPWSNAEESVAVDMAAQASARTELVGIIHRAYQRDLMCAQGGAFSRRCGQGFLVEPDGADHGTSQPADLVYVEGDRCEAGKIPDVSVGLHQAVYQAHAHAQAMATALPIHLMAFLASAAAFDTRMMTESYMFLRSVPRLPFAARVHGAQVANALAPGTPMAVIEGGCAVVTGDSPFMVLDRLEVAESTARAIIKARALGLPEPIPDALLAKL
jgi:L-fuculose-phosphate aldolase